MRSVFGDRGDSDRDSSVFVLPRARINRSSSVRLPYRQMTWIMDVPVYFAKLRNNWNNR